MALFTHILHYKSLSVLPIRSAIASVNSHPALIPFSRTAMELDLSPKNPRTAFSGHGGSYLSWSPDDLPMLRAGSIGAAKLELNERSLALPAFSDSGKVAYVLQGSGSCGIVLPETSSEKVLPIKEGDAIALPFGVVTWWFNPASTQLIILFLGETSKGHRNGEFTNFQLTDAKGILTGFSTEFVSRATDLTAADSEKLTGSQQGSVIVKIPDSQSMPKPSEAERKGMVLNCLEAPLDVDIKGGGCVVVLNTQNLPLVSQVGLGADLVRIYGRSMCSPGFSCDSAYQVTYIIRGSGRVQVVGIDGKRVLETRVRAGCLFIVPRFFVVSKIADDEGLQWFSIITTPNPVFTHLAGRTSVWKALSPEVLQASFNILPEMEQLFRSKRTSDEIFFAPK